MNLARGLFDISGESGWRKGGFGSAREEGGGAWVGSAWVCLLGLMGLPNAIGRVVMDTSRLWA